MKLMEAIRRIDELKHNTYTTGEKIAWLSELDGMVKKQIIDTHECDDKEKAITEYIQANIAAHEEAVVEYMRVHEVSREEAEKNVEFREIKYKEANEHIKATRNDIFFTGYTEKDAEDGDGPVLLIPAPWDSVYVLWLQAQIDFYNGEYDRYNNSIAAASAVLQSFESDYHRTHSSRRTAFHQGGAFL